MKTSDFDYFLPQHFIAQTPIEPRDASRLLVVNRKIGSLEHASFVEIGNYLKAGDLLVINETKVISARLFAQKTTGGKVEILLLRKVDERIWECLVGGKGFRQGSIVKIVPNGPDAEVREILEGSRRIIRFSHPIELYLPRLGHVPLPPYIHQPLTNRERYQTVFASIPGSVAAPTAGLHFTEKLISKLKEKGVHFANITLHIGLDTFSPVVEEDPNQHQIHTEWCSISKTTVDLIHQTKLVGGRIVAVGTTSVRSLESLAHIYDFPNRPLESFEGNINLFILPGFSFKLVDAMITNFHLPRSTLIMLVSAFAGRELIFHAYDEAKNENYRFFSFGDAMLIL